MEFSKEEELTKWRAKYAEPARYIVVATENQEIILKPTKSTKTLDYGYFRSVTIDKLNDALAKLSEAGYDIVNARAYHWNSETGMNSAPA